MLRIRSLVCISLIAVSAFFAVPGAAFEAFTVYVSGPVLNVSESAPTPEVQSSGSLKKMKLDEQSADKLKTVLQTLEEQTAEDQKESFDNLKEQDAKVKSAVESIAAAKAKALKKLSELAAKTKKEVSKEAGEAVEKIVQIAKDAKMTPQEKAGKVDETVKAQSDKVKEELAKTGLDNVQAIAERTSYAVYVEEGEDKDKGKDKDSASGEKSAEKEEQ